jgi:hypothetical protein
MSGDFGYGEALGDGKTEKGIMQPKGNKVDTRLGYIKGTINPDALPRSGRHGAPRLNIGAGTGRTEGFPGDLPRSGRHGGK